jgi:uroporphyrin-III C-methyltransferase/precorrin-2 dehydrogenase/sirohydrochlorin ferrochelatase
MKSFPMFLRMDGRRVVICGGGTEAARKARLIRRTEAEIVVVAAALEAELAGLVASGRARQVPEATGATFANTALAFIATGDLAEDTRLAALARAAGAVVNVVDRPDPGATLCTCLNVGNNAIVTAIETRGLVSVAQVGAALGAGTNCGSCRSEIAALIEATRHRQAAE